MKNLFLIFVLFFSTQISFSQDYKTVRVNSMETYNEQKFHDEFSFQFTTPMTKEQVMDAAKYYKDHFSVTFNAKDNTFHVKMVDQDWKHRSIMRRLFAGLYISKVMIDGKTLGVDDFFKEYVYTTDQIPAKK